MRQPTFASAGFEVHRKQTRRERFLSEMEAVVSWDILRALIEPHYPKGERGRPPVGIERMLRIYFLQQWFNLSDPQAEEAIYDSSAMRGFIGIDLGREPAPDETTINDHLGDALWKAGHKIDARFQWNHALTFSDDASEKATIESKLKSGLTG